MFNLEVLPNTSRQSNGESGQALVAALAAIAFLSLIAVAVLALSTGQMSITARDRQSLQALNVAEAGVNRALWEIENNPDYTGNSDPVSFKGGSYTVTVSSEVDENNGQQFRIIESTGVYPQSGGMQVSRKIRVRAEVVPRALASSIFASFNIFVAGSTRETFLAPLDWRASGARGGDLGSNHDIVFQDRATRLNYRDPPNATTYDSLFGPPNPPTSPVPRGNILAGGLVKGPAGQVYSTIDALKADFKYVDMAAIVPLTQEIILPRFDFSETTSPYITGSTGARNNITNKPNPGDDGYYSASEFASLFTGVRQVELSGMIYVLGDVTIPVTKTLKITNGGLVVKGNVTINNNSSLIVTHNEATKYYPGLFAYSTEGDPTLLPAGTGAQITIYGTIDIEGLVYTERAVIWNGYAQVKGGVVVSSQQTTGEGFKNQNATIVLQYDPDVQNTLGVIPISPTLSYSLIVKQIVFWRELTP